MPLISAYYQRCGYFGNEYLSQLEFKYHSASESSVWSEYGFVFYIVMLCPLLEETREHPFLYQVD